MIVLHLGSNLGSRNKNLSIARFLIESRIGTVVKASSLYETSAWGNTEQDDFLNVAYVVETELSPEDLLKSIHDIEQKMGRVRLELWGERLIDIDILFYNDQIIKKANLKIPHPEITNRNFVLVPLNEIIPEFIHPVLKKSINKLLTACSDTGEVRLYNQ